MSTLVYWWQQLQCSCVSAPVVVPSQQLIGTKKLIYNRYDVVYTKAQKCHVSTKQISK